MRGDVNLARLRELAAAIRAESWEALLSLEVSTAPTEAGLLWVRSEPMRLGSIRIARPFEFPLAPRFRTADRVPDALDALLLALAGCAAATVAISLSLQGASPTLIGVRAHADGTACPGAAARLGYDIKLDGQVTAGQAMLAANRASRFGIVHRTLAEPAAVRIQVASPRGRQTISGGEPGNAGGFAPREVTVAWQSGLHAISEELSPAAEIDQPKQLAGADLAPSPEEYLLAALAAEATGQVMPAQVHAAARLDLRGRLGMGDMKVGLQDMMVQCLTGPEDETSSGQAMRRWAAEGRVLRLLTGAHPPLIQVAVGSRPLAALPG